MRAPHSPPAPPAAPAPAQALTEDLADSIASDNIPIFADEEKFNAAITTSVDRLEAQLNGQAVPGAGEAGGGAGP